MREEEFAAGSERVKAHVKKSMQRHHDRYVRLERAGKLSEEERPNFELAMRREQKGQVQPLSVKPSPQPGE